MGEKESSSADKNSVMESSSLLFIHSSDHPGFLLVSKKLNVDSDLADSVVYAATAREIWQDFEDRFSQGKAPRIFQIQKMIVSHTQGTMSVSLYYTKLKALWDELVSYNLSPTCSCGVRGQILLMNPLPSVCKAYSLITQEEKQRGIAVRNTKSNNFSQNRSRGHDANGNPLHCSYCDRDYHTVETCHKLHGYPPRHNAASSTGSNSGSNRISGRNYGGNSSTRQTPTAHQVDANSSLVQ
ncbi:hypothetical protein L3X38_038159 [Prunus dulcis]|uniref:Retrotransposon gag domain-containing protein n=1 Tax=Prunus dulcis TaxID=3755 RepID=A0AAD4V6Z7_PRUDU|nr:hypothetical protein L3X38_038159 [Prunus dulcis]